MSRSDSLTARPGACPEDEALAAFLDGTLAPGERAALEAHALGCAACREALAAAGRALVAAADEAARGAPPPGPPAERVILGVAAGRAGRPAAVGAPVPGAGARPDAGPRAHRSPVRPVPRGIGFATAAGLLLAIGALAFVARRAGPGAPPEVARAGGGSLASLVVASVAGRLEVREAGADDWRPLRAGERLAPEAALRTVDYGPATLVFEGDLSMSFRREVAAVIRAAPGTIDVEVAAGGVAVSPPEDARVRVVVPEGEIATVGAPVEVLVDPRKRRGTLVIARADAGVTCATRHGEVALDPGQHTILFHDRPPRPPRAFPFRGPHKGRRGGHGPGDRRGPCQPPGGPELERLYRDGPT